MKLKAYHSIIVFAVLVASAIFSSVSNYRRAQYAIIQDMNRALSLTLQQNQYPWITPDTIQSYRSHLHINLLKENSNLCYVVEDKKSKSSNDGATLSGQLSSSEMMLNSHSVCGYANCSMADIFGISNQHTSLLLSLASVIWALTAIYWQRRNRKDKRPYAFALSYSAEKELFFNPYNQQPVKFTPMQEQLMLLFMQNEEHKVSKQEICNTLWPKKPDASETLYTLIRRIKPVLETTCHLTIKTERGKAYQLTEM